MHNIPSTPDTHSERRVDTTNLFPVDVLAALYDQAQRIKALGDPNFQPVELNHTDVIAAIAEAHDGDGIVACLGSVAIGVRVKDLSNHSIDPTIYDNGIGYGGGAEDAIAQLRRDKRNEQERITRIKNSFAAAKRVFEEQYDVKHGRFYLDGLSPVEALMLLQHEAAAIIRYYHQDTDDDGGVRKRLKLSDIHDITLEEAAEILDAGKSTTDNTLVGGVPIGRQTGLRAKKPYINASGNFGFNTLYPSEKGNATLRALKPALVAIDSLKTTELKDTSENWLNDMTILEWGVVGNMFTGRTLEAPHPVANDIEGEAQDTHTENAMQHMEAEDSLTTPESDDAITAEHELSLPGDSAPENLIPFPDSYHEEPEEVSNYPKRQRRAIISFFSKRRSKGDGDFDISSVWYDPDPSA